MFGNNRTKDPSHLLVMAGDRLRASLEGAALDLLRLPHVEMPPRGLVLVVGCVGVLLDLCDEPPGWEGCQTILKGRAVRRAAAIPMRRGRGAAVPQGSFWQQLERFDASNVTDAQRETLLGAIASDVGGLMQPHHMEQVSRGAAALGRWLQAASEIIKELPAPPAPSPPSNTASPLFTPVELPRCCECGVQLQWDALAEHEALCKARKRNGLAVVPSKPSALLDEDERARIAALATERVHRLRCTTPPKSSAASLPWRQPPPVEAETAPQMPVEPSPPAEPPVCHATLARTASPSPSPRAPPPPVLDAPHDASGYDYLLRGGGHTSRWAAAAAAATAALQPSSSGRIRAAPDRRTCATSRDGISMPGLAADFRQRLRLPAGPSAHEPLGQRRWDDVWLDSAAQAPAPGFAAVKSRVIPRTQPTRPGFGRAVNTHPPPRI